MIDLHAHVIGGGGESGPASRVPPLAADPIARAGITSVVGLLGTDCTTRSPRDLVARTLGLREEGLSAWCWTGGYEVPPPTLTGSVRGDVVFVDPVIGAGEVAISDHRSSQPTLDELLRLAADCHVAGLMSGKAGVLHLHVGDGPRGLLLIRQALEVAEIPARVYHPTHVNRQPRLFEEAMELARLGCTVDVTAFPPADDDPAIPADVAIERWLAAGLPKERLTVSSDGGGCLPTFDADGRLIAMDVGRPGSVSDTMRALLVRGHGLAEVLPFFTTHPARLLRLSRKGRLGVGADADLVVLGAGGEVSRVMARGRWWGEKDQTQ
jgi:beta-aspartyl-dipeptidase (metallo-type)